MQLRYCQITSGVIIKKTPVAVLSHHKAIQATVIKYDLIPHLEYLPSLASHQVLFVDDDGRPNEQIYSSESTFYHSYLVSL